MCDGRALVCAFAIGGVENDDRRYRYVEAIFAEKVKNLAKNRI